MMILLLLKIQDNETDTKFLRSYILNVVLDIVSLIFISDLFYCKLFDVRYIKI